MVVLDFNLLDWIILLGPQNFGDDDLYAYAVVTNPTRTFNYVLVRDVDDFNEVPYEVTNIDININRSMINQRKLAFNPAPRFRTTTTKCLRSWKTTASTHRELSCSQSTKETRASTPIPTQDHLISKRAHAPSKNDV